MTRVCSPTSSTASAMLHFAQTGQTKTFMFTISQRVSWSLYEQASSTFAAEHICAVSTRDQLIMLKLAGHHGNQNNWHPCRHTERGCRKEAMMEGSRVHVRLMEETCPASIMQCWINRHCMSWWGIRGTSGSVILCVLLGRSYGKMLSRQE